MFTIDVAKYKRVDRIATHSLPISIHSACKRGPNSLQHSRNAACVRPARRGMTSGCLLLTRSSGDPVDLAAYCGDLVTFGTTVPVAHDFGDPLTSLNTKFA
jgi:hypothetical protein